LVSASHDGTARLWDLETKKERTQFTGHERALTSAILSPDGKTLASASFDKTVRLWEVTTGKENVSQRWKLPRPGSRTARL
jgi:WD40 repeat protein